MDILISITDDDVRRLKLSVSVSRILKQAAELLSDNDETLIEADQQVTADYLRDLEPILNRLFMQAKAAIKA